MPLILQRPDAYPLEALAERESKAERDLDIVRERPGGGSVRCQLRMQGSSAAPKAKRPLALREDDRRKHAASGVRRRGRPIVGETDRHVKANSRLTIRPNIHLGAPLSDEEPREASLRVLWRSRCHGMRMPTLTLASRRHLRHDTMAAA
jgi:hypothetical protein